MTTDEIVKALRWLVKETEFTFAAENLNGAADLIESLQSQLSASQQRERDARNELCLSCRKCREAHKGACDGCGWMV